MRSFPKYSLILFLFLLSSQYLYSQEINTFYEIQGVVKGLGSRKVILGNKPNGYNDAFKLKYFDSCYSSNDSFYFKGFVDEPNWFSIEIEGVRGWSTFILENSKISFTGEMDNDRVSKVIVKGSEEYDSFKIFKSRIHPLQVEQATFWDKHDSAKRISDSTAMLKWTDKIRGHWKLITDTTLDYIKHHPKNFVSLYELNKSLSLINIDSAKSAFLVLSPELQNHSLGKNLKYKLFDKSSTIKINAAVPNFTLKDTSGKSVALNTIKAKYILLDFWASWCGPCIKQFDHLKTLYKKYQNKGLEIVGINIDIRDVDWIKAVNQHKIPWPTLSDLNGIESEPCKLFDIKAIPQLYLLDSSYNLIALEIKSDELDELLNKYFEDL